MQSMEGLVFLAVLLEYKVDLVLCKVGCEVCFELDCFVGSRWVFT